MNKKLLIIGFVWPEPKSSAAGSRMMQLIETFQLADYEITFASASSSSNNAFNLKDIGVTQVSIELNSSSFDDFIKVLNPNVVMFDRFMTEEQFGWRIAEHCPDALRILDTEDLHCLRKGRHKALKDNANFNKSYLFNDTAKREIASIYRCDLTLIISEAEMDILSKDFKFDESLLFYLPFMFEDIPSDTYLELPAFEERNNFTTIGNFLHEPNFNAVLHLKKHIWPVIRQRLPNSQMHIYGAYASLKVNQLHNSKEGFIVNGFAESASGVLKKSRVCLAPLQFGAGLKGKLFDAMKNGTPSVTTSIGAEGIFGVLSPNGFIENNPETFASRAVELYSNKNLWKEKQRNGFRVVNTRFNKTHFQKVFMEQLEMLQQQLYDRRLNNFIGQMLQHHTLQSTKFMSKWIEAKNKI
ncbi:glycosyltransferase family 4 protein [Seonamhaeicola sediminis]|uniref:Glycosyltransferase family 4 protein n=1 Tax=Seonamhaeicola sediminis TaxID=2528206 RepID=A0A562Y9Y8_9FLAO|nr:glycosyltransferase family 4 protein [Seonamhaeicola sediminis]TWO30906.1 glycosyltransferase family 4 protein [Seonamhaeicola sediminis]